MTDPAMVRAKVVIEYDADDGYEMRNEMDGAPNRIQDPEECLLNGIFEIARILAVFGAKRHQVMDMAHEAFDRVEAHKANREK